MPTHQATHETPYPVEPYLEEQVKSVAKSHLVATLNTSPYVREYPFIHDDFRSQEATSKRQKYNTVLRASEPVCVKGSWVFMQGNFHGVTVREDSHLGWGRLEER